MGKPGGRPIRYPGKWTEPPNRDEASMCWLMWDGTGWDGQTCWGVKVDMCKSQARAWGLADYLRLISLYVPTGFRRQLVDPPRSPRPDAHHGAAATLVGDPKTLQASPCSRDGDGAAIGVAW